MGAALSALKRATDPQPRVPFVLRSLELNRIKGEGLRKRRKERWFYRGSSGGERERERERLCLYLYRGSHGSVTVLNSLGIKRNMQILPDELSEFDDASAVLIRVVHRATTSNLHPNKSEKNHDTRGASERGSAAISRFEISENCQSLGEFCRWLDSKLRGDSDHVFFRRDYSGTRWERDDLPSSLTSRLREVWHLRRICETWQRCLQFF